MNKGNRVAPAGVGVALGLVAAATAVSAEDAAPAPAVTALHCGHFIDTVAGKTLGATTIVVEGTRVREVQSGVVTPTGAKEIDLSTQTCLPGLIDSLTHLTDQTSRTAYVDQFHWNNADYAVRSTVYAKRTLLAGFTTVRNVGDQANESVALRNAINAGILPGPRMYTAGVAWVPPADTPILPMAIVATSPVTQAPRWALSIVPRMPSKPCACTTRMATISLRSCPPAAYSMKVAAVITRS